nr:sodium-dependent multivitamin transporter-like [Penaeus vannamei]
MSTPDVLQTPSTNLNTISYFSTVDYAIFTVLLIASLVAGTFAGWRSSSGDTKDFLTGGKSMNPVAITLSLLGGVVSALSVLGNTTEIYLYGTQLWMNLIGCFWGSLVVVHLLLPTIYPLGLSSMNQYLQFRFDSNLLKKLASITQIVHSAMYLGICLYAPPSPSAPSPSSPPGSPSSCWDRLLHLHLVGGRAGGSLHGCSTDDDHVHRRGVRGGAGVHRVGRRGRGVGEGGPGRAS